MANFNVIFHFHGTGSTKIILMSSSLEYKSSQSINHIIGPTSYLPIYVVLPFKSFFEIQSENHVTLEHMYCVVCTLSSHNQLSQYQYHVINTLAPLSAVKYKSLKSSRVHISSSLLLFQDLPNSHSHCTCYSYVVNNSAAR